VILKKLLLATAASTASFLISHPAFAWHPIVVSNNTDPTIVMVKFKSPGISPQKFSVDIGAHWVGVIGPLREDGGPCLRTLVITLIDRLGEDVAATSATPINVCIETWINVAQTHAYPGGDTFVATHGQGTGPAGRPGP
jgi:hypothetical protein